MACNWAWTMARMTAPRRAHCKSLGSNLDNREHEHENMSKTDACKTNITLGEGEEKTWSAQQSWLSKAGAFSRPRLFSLHLHNMCSSISYSNR